MASTKDKKSLLDSSSSECEESDSSSSSSSNDVKKNFTSKPLMKINEKYAKEYTSRKRMQELKTLEQEQKKKVSFSLNNDDGDDNDSTSESEDEDGELLTPDMDMRIVQTIHALRKKDNKIYDDTIRFFPEKNSDESLDDDSDNDGDDESDTGEKKKKHKVKKYKDIVREQILDKMKKENDGNVDDDEDDGATNQDRYNSYDPKSFIYDDEQRALRSAFLKGVNSDSDNDEEILKKKAITSTHDISSKEQRLQEEIDKLASTTDIKNKDKPDDPRGEVENADEFLLDFIKNKRWIDTTPVASHFGNVGDLNDPTLGDDDSEDELEKMEAFESRYNFRFEEQQAQNRHLNDDDDDDDDDDGNKDEKYISTPRIVSYARTSDHTIRKKDESRKLARQARKERKLVEKKQKEEQLRRLKNAKREEMEKKKDMILKVAGSFGKKKIEEETLAKLLDGDYNEDKFEELMKDLYDEDYYEGKEAMEEDVEALRKEIMAEEGLNEKGEGWFENDGDDNYDEDEAYAPDGGNDYDEEGDNYDNDEDINNNDENVVDPIKKQLQDKIQEELYKLDYEDMIGDMPCRFSYRQVEPNSYGLSTEEILFAKDSTLKQYVSLKKMAPYQDGSDEYHVNAKKRKRFREMLKNDWQEQMEEEGTKDTEDYDNIDSSGAGNKKSDEGKKKTRRRQKKKKDSDPSDMDDEKITDHNQGEKSNDKEDKPKRRKKKGKKIDKRMQEEENKANEQNKVENNEDLKKKDDLEGSVKVKNTNKSLEKKKKKSKKVSKLETKTGVPASRLASYGL